MHAPQIIMLSLIGLNLLIVANRHGMEQPRYNIWVSLVSTALSIGLLMWGGFFNV